MCSNVPDNPITIRAGRIKTEFGKENLKGSLFELKSTIFGGFN